MNPTLAEMASEMIELGVERIHVLAWRDLDDPDAGGSEVHADEFMRRWAAAGLSVLHRTSAAVGRPVRDRRNGYDVVRRGGRMSVFARVPVAETLSRMGPYDALVEIWNGVPWLSPVWCRKPRVLILHHVHGPMWDQIFPRPVAAFGRWIETGFAPRFYRNTPTITTSLDTQHELIELGWRPELVHTGPVGVDPFFTPSDGDWWAAKADRPTVLVVGRQAPVKRMEIVLAQAARARVRVPDLEVVLVGDGPERRRLENWVAEHEASAWVRFVGRVDRERLREHYRSAWLVASASLAEGWGLALTEAAGCGTPAVATEISGHRCSVVDGTTGLLVSPDDVATALVRVLTDGELRRRMSQAAHERARSLSWDQLAIDVLAPLLHQARQRANR